MLKTEKNPTITIPKNHSLRVAIVRARFNKNITASQCESAEQFLAEQGIPYDIYEVSGCYELPNVLQQCAQSKKYSALVALGCLIKGETIHFEIISYSVGKGVMDVSLKHNIPIGFGVITANTQEQALSRVHIGHDATYAAVESALLLSTITA